MHKQKNAGVTSQKEVKVRDYEVHRTLKCTRLDVVTVPLVLTPLSLSTPRTR